MWVQVVVECPKPLFILMAGLCGQDGVVDRWRDWSEFYLILFFFFLGFSTVCVCVVSFDDVPMNIRRSTHKLEDNQQINIKRKPPPSLSDFGRARECVPDWRSGPPTNTLRRLLSHFTPNLIDMTSRGLKRDGRFKNRASRYNRSYQKLPKPKGLGLFTHLTLMWNGDGADPFPPHPRFNRSLNQATNECATRFSPHIVPK